VFGFVSGDFFNNSPQDLDLRYILGGGIGFHAIKTANTTLDLLPASTTPMKASRNLMETESNPLVCRHRPRSRPL